MWGSTCDRLWGGLSWCDRCVVVMCVQPTDQARIEQWYSESPVYKSGNRLRDYQVQGVNWLAKNYYQRRNSLLADEMGLGKTVQAIAFLEHLHREQGIRGPFLVLVPLSTLYFWRQVAETWTVPHTTYPYPATPPLPRT